jgi:hypothetical protein
MDAGFPTLLQAGHGRQQRDTYRITYVAVDAARQPRRGDRDGIPPGRIGPREPYVSAV